MEHKNSTKGEVVMHTSVIEVTSPAWPVPVQEPKYAKELRRVALPVEANDASWSAIKGTWEIGTQVVMLNDAMKIAEELQYKVDWLTRHVEVIERDNASLHREKMRLQDEVDECMRRLREVIVERDEWYVKAKPTDARVVELTKERDEYAKGVEDSARAYADMSIKHQKEVAQLREQLATVQAEAAAMRRLIDENDSRLNDLIRRIGASADTGWITHQLRHVLQKFNTTAGRELLDEMTDLRNRLAAISEMHHDLDRENARLERKARTAKRAYVETLRGKIDPAWFGKNFEYWRYEDTDAYIFRTTDGRTESKQEGGVWACCSTEPEWFLSKANRACVPCDEHGKRIDEPKSINDEVGTTGHNGLPVLDVDQFIVDKAIETDYERIADLERQLAEQKRDAELCRELRAWIKSGVFSVVGYSVVIGCQCVPTELAELLVSIRDGGAK